MEKDYVLVVLFTALVAALGLVPPITLMSGVPITAQSMGIMLCGTVLGARKGALAVLLLIVLVTLGLPLLAGGRGGIGVYAGPTVGFFLGWLPAAFVTGLIVERLRGLPLLPVAIGAAILGGIVVLYACGAVGMALVLDKPLAGVLPLLLPFVPGDLIKAALAGMITAGVARARPDSLLSRRARA